MTKKIKKLLKKIQKRYLLRREIIVYAYICGHENWGNIIWSFPRQNKKFRELIKTYNIRIQFINEMIWQFGKIYHRRVYTGDPSLYNYTMTSKGKVIIRCKWKRMIKWEEIKYD